MGQREWQGDILRDQDGLPLEVCPPLLDRDNLRRSSESPRLSAAPAQGRPDPRTPIHASRVLRLWLDPRKGGDRYMCTSASSPDCTARTSIGRDLADDVVVSAVLDAVGHLPAVTEVEVTAGDTLHERADIAAAPERLDEAMASGSKSVSVRCPPPRRRQP